MATPGKARNSSPQIHQPPFHFLLPKPPRPLRLRYDLVNSAGAALEPAAAGQEEALHVMSYIEMRVLARKALALMFLETWVDLGHGGISVEVRRADTSL